MRSSLYPTTPAKGFTALEVILVVAVLALAAAILVLASNPGAAIVEARNSQRSDAVANVADALRSYADDHADDWPVALPDVPDDICRTPSPSCRGVVDLAFLVDGAYLTAIPVDPTATTTTTTGYLVVQNGDTVTVSAPAAERGAMISASR